MPQEPGQRIGTMEHPVVLPFGGRVLHAQPLLLLKQRQGVVGLKRPRGIAKVQDLRHGFRFTDFQQDDLALVERLEGLVPGTALDRVVHRPDREMLAFPRAHAPAERSQDPRKGHHLPDVPAFEKQPAVPHDPARLKTAGAARAGHFRRELGLVQQDTPVLFRTALAGPVHILRIERIARMGLHAERPADQRIGQAYLLHRPQDGGGKVFALGARGFGKEHRNRAVADARAERLLGELAGKRLHQLAHEPIRKTVADIPGHFAHAVEPDDDEAERTAPAAAFAAFQPELPRERRLYGPGFLREPLQQHLMGCKPGAGIKPPGLVQLQILKAQIDDAGQGRQQRRHALGVGHTGHEHAEEFPVPDERQQKLSLVRQPFRFLRTGLAGKIDGMRLEREHAVQAVPQPLLQIQQIAPDKAGRQARHAYHVRRTGTPRSAMYCLSCPIVYSP